MSETKQNLLAKQEETTSLTNDSWFYVLVKSGATYIDKRIRATNIYKFLLTLFISTESSATYTGTETMMAKDGSSYVKVTTAGLNSYRFYEFEFDNSDLSSFILTVVHGKGTRKIDVWYYDNNWVKQSLDGLLTLDSVNQFSINFGMDITGTHTIYYKFY